jgi:hypothetical protein
MSKPFPRCHICGDGEMIPLSDDRHEGATVWTCTNPLCGCTIGIGDMSGISPEEPDAGADGDTGRSADDDQ